MQIRILGPVDVLVNGAEQPVSGLRRKSVLAVLALHRGDIVSSDRLADLVWAGEQPTTALNTLQRHVSYLRQVLGRRDAIIARPPGYRLDPDQVDTDASAAERLISSAAQASGRARAQQLRDALALADASGETARREALSILSGLGARPAARIADRRPALLVANACG